MSDSYVGGSGSGSSSGASRSGNPGSSSALTMSILGSVALAGENVLLNSSAPNLAARPSATPPTSPTSVTTLGGGISTWVIVIVLFVVGLFAYREL